MDCKTQRLNVSIVESTYDDLILLAKRQNTSPDNLTDRLLREGITATYERWPNLKAPEKGGGDE